MSPGRGRRLLLMATFILIPGAGSDAWHWHLVEPELRSRGHETVAVDLPCADDDAGFIEYADAVVNAIGDRREGVVLVAQSLGGFTAPLVADRVPVQLIVLVAAMVPLPGESPGDWWSNTGYEAPEPFDEEAVFLHDVPPEVAAESANHICAQSNTPFERPYPFTARPDVPTRFLLCRDDRFFPAEFLRSTVRHRLGIEPDEMASGHCPALAHPVELAIRLDTYWRSAQLNE